MQHKKTTIPEPIDIGGSLSTIPEGDNEYVDITVDAFYAELMSNEQLTPSEYYADVFDVIIPANMNTDESVLAMSKEDADHEDSGQ